MGTQTKNIEQAPAHSLLGASTSDRWGSCPGSVNLSKGIVTASSPYAEEGTRAHALAAFILSHGWIPHEVTLDNGNKFEPDDEMLEAVKVYTDLIKKEKAEEAGAKLMVEVRLDLSSIHPKMFGTADAVVYYPSKKLLRVYDYKHGKGVAVDVLDNSQLQYYGLGALLQLGLPCTTVELVVVQPRCYHDDGPVRRWEIPAFDMLDFASDLKKLAYATEDKNAPLNPGDHCRWCPAAGICPALLSKAQEVAKAEFSHVKAYDPEKLAASLKWMDVLDGYISSVRDFAYQEAMHGRCPPGYKLVDKRGTRQWRENVNADTLQNLFGLHQPACFEMKLKSPAQIEKIIPKELKVKMPELTITKSSGVALVPSSDKREASKLDAKSEFMKLEDKQETAENIFS